MWGEEAEEASWKLTPTSTAALLYGPLLPPMDFSVACLPPLRFASTTCSVSTMKLFFLSPSGGGNVLKKNNKKGSKRPPSLSDPPSFASSSTSSDSATTTTTVLPPPRRPSLIGRNASCLDAEYDSAPELGSSSASSSSSSALRRGGDRKFTLEELELVLRRLCGGREEDVAEMLAEADRNGDGRISLEELLDSAAAAAAVAVAEEEEDEEEELRVAFRVYDANGDGKISAEELRGVFMKMGDESCSIDDCRRMIGEVDSDGDGFVCFRDFANMMSGVRHRDREVTTMIDHRHG